MSGRFRAMCPVWSFAAVLILSAVGRAQTPDPYGWYTDWRGWARTTTQEQASLASSFDRSGGNLDYSYYESPTGHRLDATVATVKTIQGPGVISRFWMPHATARRGFPVRMYFDGEVVPRIDTTSTAVLGGTFGYFSSPLVTTCAGGQVSYEPIPFASSLRIETENRVLPANGGFSYDFHYYQYNYRTFPAGTPIASYTGTLSPAQQASRAAAVSVFTNVGQHPAGENPAAIRVLTPAGVVPAGGSLVLAEPVGPGMIRKLHVRMAGATDAQLEGLVLRVFYDALPAPAIEASVADFFAAGHGRAGYKTLPLGSDSPEGFYCYWPMPFQRNARIRLDNSTAAGIPIDSALVEFEQGAVESDLGYLHAVVNRSVYGPGSSYHPILAEAGRGHYVGSIMYLRQAAKAFQMLEGDETIIADGTNVLRGTGLEDAYNGGYYFNWVGIQADEPEGGMPPSAIRPLSGIVHVSQTDTLTRAECYRWLIADRVPFLNSIDVKIESFYSVVGAEWASVAFWYQLPPPRGDFDGDSDVDRDDLAHFAGCMTGAGGGPVDVACDSADFDYDHDVDQSDYGVLQRCFSGTGFAAGPGC